VRSVKVETLELAVGDAIYEKDCEVDIENDIGQADHLY